MQRREIAGVGIGKILTGAIIVALALGAAFFDYQLLGSGKEISAHDIVGSGNAGPLITRMCRSGNLYLGSASESSRIEQIENGSTQSKCNNDRTC